jgi:hypothetical protein
MKIDREQFKKLYAERSNLTIQDLERLGLEVYPCECDDARCQGWQMLTKDGAKTMCNFGLLRQE